MIPEILMSLQAMYFSASQNQPYMKSVGVWEEKNVIAVEYDFNKNGKTDAYGFFEILKQKNDSTYTTSEYAKMLWSDKNEDGDIDLMLLDTDNNGSLETTLEKRIVEKRT